MRPVLRGLCSYESLIDGSVSLVDVTIMNDALNIQDENAARVRIALERK